MNDTPWNTWRSCENDIKMEFKDMGWINVDWIDVTGDWGKWRAVVCMAMNRRVP